MSSNKEKITPEAYTNIMLLFLINMFNSLNRVNKRLKKKNPELFFKLFNLTVSVASILVRYKFDSEENERKYLDWFMDSFYKLTLEEKIVPKKIRRYLKDKLIFTDELKNDFSFYYHDKKTSEEDIALKKLNWLTGSSEQEPEFLLMLACKLIVKLNQAGLLELEPWTTMNTYLIITAHIISFFKHFGDIKPEF
ncbi:MAG: hypothetical protein ACE5WD_09795 [Candidatus Aminicenantia bacterium]